MIQRMPRALVEMGESRTPRPEPSAGNQLRACPAIYRQVRHPALAPCDGPQSRPLAGFTPGYATMTRSASPLNDASTARGDEAASTLTLLPQAARARAGWRLPVTSFCRLFTRPDGTSARASRGSDPVETTHPQDLDYITRTPVRPPEPPGAGSGTATPQRPRWRSAISRCRSRRASRSAMSWRRSWSCLPRATPSWTLARPRSSM